jgi:16S rRNA pseudouridine516 synthase
LTILSPHLAEVVLTEGKYHQIKRMFGRFRNPVLALHRSKVGNLSLDNDMSEGQCRLLTSEEVSGMT